MQSSILVANGCTHLATATFPYKLLGKVPTGTLARTALLVPQLNRYFVAVPQHGTANAEVQVFEVR